MDIEFHYWMTGLIAHRAGFTREESKIIAYCSQYIDDNDVCLSIQDKKKKEKPYGNFISQTMNILKPKDQLMRIYPMFHFVPGDPGATSARRRDGKMHLLNTTPNSEFANELMSIAFKSSPDIRLYRIGVVTHTYVDTWAHQNFVGWYDNFNAIGTNVLPNIGHADAQHHPDWPGHRWTDTRLVDGDIHNNHRFLSAAERLFEHYCNYHISQKRYPKKKKPKWKTLELKLIEAMGPATSGTANPGREARISHYKKNFASWLPKYDEGTWFNDAVTTKVRGLRDSKEGLLAKFTIFDDEHFWREDRNKESTKWYKFQEAVKEHERAGLNLLSPIFKQLGVDLKKL